MSDSLQSNRAIDNVKISDNSSRENLRGEVELELEVSVSDEELMNQDQNKRIDKRRLEITRKYTKSFKIPTRKIHDKSVRIIEVMETDEESSNENDREVK